MTPFDGYAKGILTPGISPGTNMSHTGGGMIDGGGGKAPPGIPVGAYVTEDGTTRYVAEDGITTYMTES